MVFGGSAARAYMHPVLRPTPTPLRKPAGEYPYFTSGFRLGRSPGGYMRPSPISNFGHRYTLLDVRFGSCGSWEGFLGPYPSGSARTYTYRPAANSMVSGQNLLPQRHFHREGAGTLHTHFPVPLSLSQTQGAGRSSPTHTSLLLKIGFELPETAGKRRFRGLEQLGLSGWGGRLGAVGTA